MSFILVLAALAILSAVYLLVQFWNRALAEQEPPVGIAPAAEESSRDALKAA
jgi:hypothetical protein